MRIGPRPLRETWALILVTAVLAACSATAPGAASESSPAVRGSSSDRPGPGGSGGGLADRGETRPPKAWMAASPARLPAPSDKLRLSLKTVVEGKITPKSVVASGTNPEKETYTIVARTDVKEVTAVRVEALPDASLVAKGPGRSDNGNAVLTDLRLAVSPAAAPTDRKPAKFKAAMADFSQQNFPVAHAIDDCLAIWQFQPLVVSREPVDRARRKSEAARLYSCPVQLKWSVAIPLLDPEP